jgi:hypothetical protein
VDILGLAQRAYGEIWIAEFPDSLKAAPTASAFVFINWHTAPPQPTKIRTLIINNGANKNKSFRGKGGMNQAGRAKRAKAGSISHEDAPENIECKLLTPKNLYGFGSKNKQLSLLCKLSDFSRRAFFFLPEQRYDSFISTRVSTKAGR